MRRFLRERGRWEEFGFEATEEAAAGGVGGGGAGWRGRLERWLPREQTGRYLRAVRAEKGCLAAGCHLGSGAGGEAAGTGGEAARAGAPAFTEGQLAGVISVTLPGGQTSTTLLFNRVFIVTAGVLASIIAVVTFYLITARLILQPVRALRAAADKVMVGEEAGAQTEAAEKTPWQEATTITEGIRTGDEFERLAHAFHEMLGRLKMAHDRLREANRALDMQLGELTARNLALFEANRLKNEFLANVSHELRTPLHAILGFAEIVQEKTQADGDAKTARYAQHIVQAGKGLLAIINDLLDVAKIEAGRVEVRWEKCSVREIAEALLQLMRPLTEEKELTATLGVDEGLGLIETDPGKVQQILFNLLSNAIKFTPRGGRIGVEASWLDEDAVVIRVRDTGPGIAEGEREKIFEKFRQVDASVTREHSGTGLGLAIVKELVGILGGSITVGGSAGEGAVFTVVLPARRGGGEAGAKSASG